MHSTCSELHAPVVYFDSRAHHVLTVKQVDLLQLSVICLHTSIVNCQQLVRLACNVAGVLPGADTNLVHLGHSICKKESLTNGGRHCRNATNELCTTCRVHMKCCCIHGAFIVDASLSYCYCRENDIIIDKQQRNLFKACRHAQEPV